MKNNSIGSRIKSARLKAGISQVDLAQSVGILKQTLYKYENGIITNIPSDKIEKISIVCNVTPAYIMGWESQDNGFYKKFSLLDDIDRSKILAQINIMLEQEKYHS